MRRRPYRSTRLLKWYPPQWRARYGDEFVAYVDDTLDGARPTYGFIFSIVRGALGERVREWGLVGAQSTSDVQSRAGSLLVLCAWSLFILAGASFSKLSEHFVKAMPADSSSPARVGFDVVAWCGVVGMFIVVLGAVVALPTFVTFLRSGGWDAARRPVLHAVTLTVFVVAALVPLAGWAHHLTSRQRNGGDGAYSAAFVAWVILIALTVVSWDRVAVHSVARMSLPPRVLRLEALLATGLSVLMVTITAGTAYWWAEVARVAPWFLQGARYGTPSSPLTANLLVTLTMMTLAACTGAFGVSRIARSWRRA